MFDFDCKFSIILELVDLALLGTELEDKPLLDFNCKLLIALNRDSVPLSADLEDEASLDGCIFSTGFEFCDLVPLSTGLEELFLGRN